MAIYRVKHDKKNPYVMINKASLWDPNLSLAALAVWVKCMSRPDDWEFNAEELARACGVNKGTMKKYLVELEDYGYIKRTRTRENGKFSRIYYDFMEHPSLSQEEDDEEFKKCSPRTGKPSTVNSPLLSTNKELIKETPPNPHELKHCEKYKEQEGEGAFSKELLRKKMPTVKSEEFEYAWGEYQKSPPGSIRAVRQWLMAVIQRYRFDNRHIEERKSDIEIHKFQAGIQEAKNPRRIVACRNQVEFINGSHFKAVPYDLSHEEWLEKTGFEDVKLRKEDDFMAFKV